MGIKQLYNDNLRKLPNEYGDVSVMTNFRFPIPLRLHMKFGFDRLSGFGEEDL